MSRKAVPGWALSELATFFVTMDLERSPGAKVVRDVKLPEQRSRRDRQVDVAVTYEHSGIEFLHVIEVEDRTGAFGIEALDELQGKASKLGAAAATIVVTDRYTKSVLAAVRDSVAPLQLRAMHLGPPQEGELAQTVIDSFSTIPTTDDTRGEKVDPIELRPLAYRDAITNEIRSFVFIGNVLGEGIEALACLSFPPPVDDSSVVTFRAFTKAGSKQMLSRITYQGPDDRLTIRADPRKGIQIELVRRTQRPNDKD